MIRYLRLSEVLNLHSRIIDSFGGAAGVRDLGALESALAQPQLTFNAEDLYPTLVEKAAALGYALIRNHPFVDGNKRTGHAAMETFLVLNGHEIVGSTDEQERVILDVATGSITRANFVEWLRAHVIMQ